MKMVNVITVLTLPALVMAMQSCSIKENRVDCPCYLDVTVHRLDKTIYDKGTAWCSVLDDGGAVVHAAEFTGILFNDGLTSCTVRKNPRTAIVVSNTDHNKLSVTTKIGNQMPKLYATRMDIDCSGETALAEFGTLGKRFVTVNLRLNDEAMSYKDQLKVTLDGPYDGLSFPSMTPHRGTFSYTTTFDDNGTTTFRIPPQGGRGLKVGIRMGTNPPATVDLYDMLEETGFDWSADSLGDFSAEITLNSVMGILEFTDWEIVILDDKRF